MLNRRRCASTKPTDILRASRRPIIVASVIDARGLSRVLRARMRAWDAVEIRLDHVGFDAYVRKTMSDLLSRGIPVIGTVRRKSEGGKWRGVERSREKVYSDIMKHVSAIDVEIESSLFVRVATKARESGVAVIGSFHDFKKTPSQTTLTMLARSAWERGADIVKIATTINSVKDAGILRRLLERFRGRRLCVIGMGTRATDVRVQLARQGSYLAYGSVGRAAAPGQISCASLRRKLAVSALRSVR